MKRTRLLLAYLAIAFVVLLSPFAEAADGPAVARVRRAGVLLWGGDIQGGEPYAYEDPKSPGRVIGFEVDLADAIAKELGVTAKFVQNDWSSLVPSLERGTFDVVMNGLEVTETRVGRVHFSRPYYVFAERLMARKTDSEIKADLASLQGRRVGTLANSLAFEMLRKVTDPVLYEGVEEPYQDLERGRTDAVLLDDIIATRYGVPKGDLRVVGDLREGYYAVGIRPSEVDLAEAVDDAVGRLATRGDLRRILEKYDLWNDRESRLLAWSASDQAAMLGKPPPPPAFNAQHVVLFVKGALVTLLISTLAMAIAMLFTALAAVLFALRTTFDPSSGPIRLIFAFEAVIIGGLGSLWGTLVGGILLGIAQSIGAAISPTWQILAGHIAFLIVLVVKPDGLFPRIRD